MDSLNQMCLVNRAITDIFTYLLLQFMDKVENHEPNKMQCHLVYESHGSYNYGVKFHGASKNFIVGAFKSRNPLLR